MSAPTIPFGPGTEPLGLSTTNFEFISLDGPQSSVENETPSFAADGTILRVAATRKKISYTANYTIKVAGAAGPARGLYDATASFGTPVWISSVNVSKPQQGDQTMAVAFWVPGTVTNQEALRADLVS